MQVWCKGGAGQAFLGRFIARRNKKETGRYTISFTGCAGGRQVG